LVTAGSSVAPPAPPPPLALPLVDPGSPPAPLLVDPALLLDDPALLLDAGVHAPP
jgi:hypothetical protein